MAKKSLTDSLKSKLKELTLQNEEFSRQLENSKKIIAMQRAAMYMNFKEIDILEKKLGENLGIYKRISEGLKGLIVLRSSKKLSPEKQKRLYYRLLLHEVSSEDISRIEIEEGYKGLKKRLNEVIIGEYESRYLNRINRSLDEKKKKSDELRDKYRF